MKVLFICSGNKNNFPLTPFIKSQAESLTRLRNEVIFYQVKEKGILGYLNNIKKIKHIIKENKVDIVHAHYSFNGLLALLAIKKIPIVVSYMGTDTYGRYNSKGHIKISSYINILISLFIQPFVSAIIVKSPNLAKYIFCKKKLNLVPNGVDVSLFSNREKEVCRKYLNIPLDSEIILFLGDKNNPRKNYSLLEHSLEYVNNRTTILHPFPLSQEVIPYYYNAADVLVLTSYNEGSPNIVKEAMACNCPVVATNVGDVRWLFGDEPGYYITNFNPKSLAQNIKYAIEFSKENVVTNGRNRILELGLDSDSIARRINSLYKSLIAKKR